MLTLKSQFRAPAESSIVTFWQRVMAAIVRILPARYCSHCNPTIPVNNRQNCPDCGASRVYRFVGFDAPELPGIYMGKWEHPQATQRAAQSAHRVVARTLIANAMAPARRPLSGSEAVLMPGSESPLFVRRDLAQKSAVQG